MPVERDDPRRHGDKLEEPLRKTQTPRPGSGGRRQTSTTPSGQTPTPGSAEGERDVDEQDQ